MTNSRLGRVVRPIFYHQMLVWATVINTLLLSLTSTRPAAATAAPMGTHTLTTLNTATGWACDADNWDAALQIHFYLDGPEGEGTFVGQTTANLPHPDVADACGGTSHHGFQFTLPTSLRDGHSHTLYAYAVNDSDGDPLLLSNSPKTIKPYAPVGHHALTTLDTALGWACDQNNWNAPLQIHFYLDGPAGNGTFAGQTTADLPRPELTGVCGGTSHHGFQFTLPASLRDGRNHTLYAYAINYGGGTNALLSNSPKTIKQYAPIGYHDVTTVDTTTGWVCDQNNWHVPLQIHFYLDYPVGYGVFAGSTLADTPRPDVAGVCGGKSHHGFQFTLPNSVHDGRNHILYAYAINYGGGTNPLLGTSPQIIPATGPAQANQLIDASNAGYTYAYAPAIIQLDSTYHMFYCSSGTGVGAWDFIRYATSADGVTWSAPQIVLQVSDATHERAACDPAVVFYNNYYYLFYSGNKPNMQTAMFVARASAIGGPYSKFTQRGTWESNPVDPAIILAPKNSAADENLFYGAGQQTVVAARGKLYSWYYDDTLNYPDRRAKLMFTTATEPTAWSAPIETNLDVSSVDVKYDPIHDQFILAEIPADHMPHTLLMRYVSSDGLNWSGEVLINADSFPDFAHNVGVSGDPAGHLLPYTLVGFGVPYDLSVQYRNECQTSDLSLPGYRPNYCWGYWDIYAVGIDNFK